MHLTEPAEVRSVVESRLRFGQILCGNAAMAGAYGSGAMRRRSLKQLERSRTACGGLTVSQVAAE